MVKVTVNGRKVVHKSNKGTPFKVVDVKKKETTDSLPTSDPKETVVEITTETTRPEPQSETPNSSTPTAKKSLTVKRKKPSPHKKPDSKKNKPPRKKKKEIKLCGKCKKQKSECECGRPLFDGKDEKTVVSKLRSIFLIGGSHEEACLYAGISIRAFYRYLEKNKEFRQDIYLLRQNPKLKARRAIFKSLDNPKMAIEYFKAKHADEFGGRFSDREPERVINNQVSIHVHELASKYGVEEK